MRDVMGARLALFMEGVVGCWHLQSMHVMSASGSPHQSLREALRPAYNWMGFQSTGQPIPTLDFCPMGEVATLVQSLKKGR